MEFIVKNLKQDMTKAVYEHLIDLLILEPAVPRPLSRLIAERLKSIKP